jgi:hypothetical protein
VVDRQQASSRPSLRRATKDRGHAIDGLGRIGERGNKTHLLFRDKAGDRAFVAELLKLVPATAAGGRRT